LPEGYLEQVPETLTWDDNVPAEMHTGQNLTEARAYYAMSKNADDNMGRILEYLDTSGLAEDTIVVFTSDHGEMLGSHGRRNKMVPYDEAVQVPLLVRWPGHVAPASRTDTLQTPLDHMPTLIRMAGLETPQGLDGIDLSPELLDGETMERDAVLMSNYTAHWDYFMTASQPGASWPEWRGVKTKQYTYARWITGETELYDDLADPEQMNDLSEDTDHAGVVDELETTLRNLLAEAHDAFLPGNAYVEWIDRERNIIETGAGPVGQ
jgi:arylsulfatase A-like enzyme